MKELAVLKWHKVGCYATAFAAIQVAVGTGKLDEDDGKTETTTEVAEQSSTVGTAQQRRDDKAQTTHWLAAGAKDGKVSLWDIY